MLLECQQFRYLLTWYAPTLYSKSQMCCSIAVSWSAAS